MTQTLTSIPTAEPVLSTPHLRLNRATDSLRVSAPSATDSRRKSVPNAKTPPPSKAAEPKPKNESPARAPDPPIDQLLSLYLDPELTIADIAFTLGVSIIRTLLLFRGEDFLKLCEAHAKEHEKRATYLARCNIDTAARAFVKIAQTCEKPETARKAAGALIRMHPESRPRVADKQPGKEAAAAPPHSKAVDTPNPPARHPITNARSNAADAAPTPPDPILAADHAGAAAA